MYLGVRCHDVRSASLGGCDDLKRYVIENLEHFYITFTRNSADISQGGNPVKRNFIANKTGINLNLLMACYLSYI